MKQLTITCSLCQSSASESDNYPKVYKVECETCDTYYVTPDLGRLLKYDHDPDWDLNPVQRAVLRREKYLYEQSPASRSDQGYRCYPFKIDNDMLIRIRNHGTLPSRAEQAANLIRFVGDTFSRTGKDLDKLPNKIDLIIGSVSLESAYQLATELVDKGLLTSSKPTSELPVSSVNLKLEGWDQYEAERRGRFHGDYGFLAMKFDGQLDRFMTNVVKPTVDKETGYKLRDLREVSKAGLIDNIMVTTIRDSRFVIVDLTHDNHGAYWEAGYAEGLGKPVIYICNMEKFKDKGTHFDTNHYTTVLWSGDSIDSFCQELAATLRRSLVGSQ